MDVNSRNRLFSQGKIDREDLWPKIVEYEGQSMTFRFRFGLDELPREPGIITIRGPRQYGKSTWLELALRDTLEDFGKGSAYFLNGDYLASHDELEAEILLLLDSFSAKSAVRRLFIDEISAVKGWEKVLKRLADRGVLKNVLVVTTGSSAQDLRRGTERLPGRKGRLPRTDFIFTGISYKDFYEQAHRSLGDKTWIAYLLSGGSPIAARELWQFERVPEYFFEIMRDWVLGEMLTSGRARPFVLSTLRTILQQGGSRLGYLGLAKKAGLSNNTIAAEYVEKLSDLLCVVPAMAWDFEREVPLQRKPCKFHFINLAVALAFSSEGLSSIHDFESLSAARQGVWIEWLVAQELVRRQCIRGDEDPLSLAYALAGDDREIDFVTARRRLYEVKRGSASAPEFAPYLKRIGDKKLTVVSHSEFQSERLLGLTLHDFLWADDFPHPYPGQVEDPDTGNEKDVFR